MKHWRLWLTTGVLLAMTGAAMGEAKQLRIARQYGINYLPMMVMEHEKLIEKHARLAGLGEIEVRWTTLSGGSTMQDALLSGSVDVASVGLPPLVNLWARTLGTPQEIKGVSALASMPLLLVTRNPSVHSLRDFTDRDKIALPAVKVSGQAILLQMAAAKLFGDAGYNSLDRLTVSLPLPEAVAALLNPSSEISAHFSAPPFQSQELKMPGVRVVLNSFEAVGGPHNSTLNIATRAFHDANPKTFGALLGATREAIAFINKDRRAAAGIYVKIAKGKDTVDGILELLNDPRNVFTPSPQASFAFAEFMHKVGTIKVRPASWKDMWFSNIHDNPGS